MSDLELKTVFTDDPTIAIPRPQLLNGGAHELRQFAKHVASLQAVDPFVMPSLPGADERRRRRASRLPAPAPPVERADINSSPERPIKMEDLPPVATEHPDPLPLATPPSERPPVVTTAKLPVATQDPIPVDLLAADLQAAGKLPPVVALIVEPPLTPTRPHNPRNLVPVALILALAAVVCAFVMRPIETMPDPVADVTRAPIVDNVTPLLERADSLMSEGQYQSTTALLAAIDPSRLDSTQQIRLNDLRSEAFLGHHLAVGSQELAGGKIEAAMTATRKVLIHRPSNTAALDMLKTIRGHQAVAAEKVVKDAQLAAAQEAALDTLSVIKQVPATERITLRSDPPGLFLINGTPVGYSPARGVKMLHGPHRIEIRREGFEVLTKLLKVTAATKMVKYTLKPLAKDGKTSLASR